ncbi:MAG: efflux RND transporter periplasmic adaptor subunit [Devosia sp.]
MRAIFSYGVALIIVLGLAVWLATGVLIKGGQGPGQGERALIGATDPVVTPDQQALLDAAEAKQKAAEDAKKAAEAADADAKAAAEAADKADTEGATKEEELKAEAEAKAEAARKAKEAADAATAAATAAEEASLAAEEAANSFKSITERNQAEGEGAEPTPRSVRIAIITAQTMPIEVPLRGRTQAKSSVTVTAQTSGIVETVAVTKGQTVKAGDLLCTLDSGARQLAVDQAQAALDQAQTAFDANKSLRDKGFAAENTALALEAALKGATAQLENAKLELGRTQIRTEAAGVVQDPLATVGNLLAAGQPCATVVELNPMLFEASVPEARIAYARLGLPAKVTTVTGETVEGKVTYIASTADDATRSFPVEIEVPNADNKIRDGITADAVVNVGSQPVHILPQSVLTLDDDGVLGIRTVEAGNKVAFHAVTIIKDTRDGVWVVGLPFKINVITVGQEFVQPGQIVDARTVEGEQAS